MGMSAAKVRDAIDQAITTSDEIKEGNYVTVKVEKSGLLAKPHISLTGRTTSEAMKQKMRKDDSVYLIGEDIAEYGGAFGVTVGMLEEFGKERIRNTPISEAAIIGVATGSAITGMRPIAEIMFSDFITIAMNQIVNQAAKIRYMFGGKAKVPMVIRTAWGGGTGAAA